MNDFISKGKQNDADIDPEIADLIGIEDSSPNENPDFYDLFAEEAPVEEPVPLEIEIKQEFTKITAFEENPKPYFANQDYYKIVLSGEGENSQKVHTLLSAFLKSENPKEKTVLRERLITAFWQLGSSIAGKIGPKLPEPKKLLLRYGILLPTLLSKEQRVIISKIIEGNDTGEPVFYVDEWLSKISVGEINPSVVDETKKIKNKQTRKINTSLDKERGHKDALYQLVKSKILAIAEIETSIETRLSLLRKHEPLRNYGNIAGPYTQDQRVLISEIQEFLRKALQIDKDLGAAIDNLDNAAGKLKELEQKAKEEGLESQVDSHVLVEEFMTVKQMAKMSVGRKGNHFPILMQQYMRANINDIATRENVITIMDEIEKIDPGLFKRTFKRQTNRIVPYIILLPCYGEFGICWEPYEKFNRATGRGRIGIPLFPKDLKTAIIYALGDLRWQVAKETASYYWMEEGITGWYYQWFTDNKMRGDVKEAFIADYYLWITKEADGMQKLDKEVRGIFWRNMPFPQDLKERLRNRGFVYNELYKKDVNISMSDGY